MERNESATITIAIATTTASTAWQTRKYPTLTTNMPLSAGNQRQRVLRQDVIQIFAAISASTSLPRRRRFRLGQFLLIVPYSAEVGVAVAGPVILKLVDLVAPLVQHKIRTTLT